MRAKRWAAAVLVVLGVAFAGQALAAPAAAELQKTFKAAKQNGDNLVDVLRTALQSGADLTDLAAAADAAGISADIVTAAALAAGLNPPRVARAVEQGSDRDLGYVEPAVSRSAADSVEAAGSPEALQRGDVEAMAVAGNSTLNNPSAEDCPDEKKCQPSSGPMCCETASADLSKCEPKDKCK